MNVFTLKITDIFYFFNNNFNKEFSLSGFLNLHDETIFSFIQYIYQSTYAEMHKQFENDITCLVSSVIGFDNLNDGDIIKFSSDLFGSVTNDGIFIFDKLNLHAVMLDFSFVDEYGVIPSKITYPRFDIDYWKDVISNNYISLDNDYIISEIKRQKFENGDSLKTINSRDIVSETLVQFISQYSEIDSEIDIAYIELRQSDGRLMKLFLFLQTDSDDAFDLNKKFYMFEQECVINGVVETCIF